MAYIDRRVINHNYSLIENGIWFCLCVVVVGSLEGIASPLRKMSRISCVVFHAGGSFCILSRIPEFFHRSEVWRAITCLRLSSESYGPYNLELEWGGSAEREIMFRQQPRSRALYRATTDFDYRFDPNSSLRQPPVLCIFNKIARAIERRRLIANNDTEL